MNLSGFKGGQKNITLSIFGGIAISVTSLLLFAVIITCMVHNEWIAQDSVSYLVPIGIFLSGLVGSIVAGIGVGQRRLVICVTSAFGLNLLMILLSWVLFGAGMRGIGVTTLVVIGSGVVAAMFPHNMSRKYIPRKRSF